MRKRYVLAVGIRILSMSLTIGLFVLIVTKPKNTIGLKTIQWALNRKP